MPRASSRSSSSRSTPARSAPAPSKSAPPPSRAPPPPAAKPAPVPPPAPAPLAQPAPQGGGLMSGLAATVMQGMAFGTGSAIAHRAVGAIAGSMSGDSSDKQVQQQQPVQAAPQVQVPQSSYNQGPCAVDLTAFNNCMRDNNNNVSSCDFYFQALQQCQASNNSY